ncbi:MAG: hypothetical protein QW625_00705 [Candidatus Nanoarchaeia archaeon]
MSIVDLLFKILGVKKKIITSDTQKKEDAQKKEILFQELKPWLENKKKEILEKLNQNLHEKEEEFKEIIEKILNSCEKLDKATPRLSKLYDAHKVVADGNKKAFLSAVRNFIKLIKFPKNSLELADFVINFEEAISEFMNENNKAFLVTKEFFTEPALELKETIQELDQFVSNFKKELEVSKFFVLKNLIEKYESLSVIEEKEKKVLKNLDDEQKKLEDCNKQIAEITNKLLELRSSKDFEKLKEVESEFDKEKQKMKNAEMELYTLFSELDALLRKLAWLKPEHKKLIDNYVNSPISALLHDSDFKFESALIALRLAIESGEIPTQDKKRTNVLKVINSILQEGYLQKWAFSYSQIKTKLEQLQNLLENLTITQQIKTLQEEQEKLQCKQDQLKKNINKLQKNLQKIAQEKDYSGISNSLQENFCMNLIANPM